MGRGRFSPHDTNSRSLLKCNAETGPNAVPRHPEAYAYELHVLCGLRLAADNHRRDGEQLLIAADVASQALRFRVVETGSKVSIVAHPERFVRESQIAAPGYNAQWGPGRGFGKGDSLPDIPLVDVAGNEVRFSQFLGKRYILYCWASW